MKYNWSLVCYFKRINSLLSLCTAIALKFFLHLSTQMKLLAIILSIYTITLSTIPCDDGAFYESEQLTSIYEKSDCGDHNSIDLCTPFCACVCCSVITVQSIESPDLSNFITCDERLIKYYQNSFIGNYNSLPFQPPQV